MSLSREAEYNINILPYRKVYTGQSSHDVNALLGGGLRCWLSSKGLRCLAETYVWTGIQHEDAELENCNY